MILKPSQLEGASAELKKEIAAVAANADAAKWDLYPTRFQGDGKVFIKLYRQQGTVSGSLPELIAFMPPTLQHLGEGVFALAKPESKAPPTK